ncbi:outer membrane beta-barrel protein [Novosphingobium flavum]|uniref:Outer membrane beta-barrel protein n=1 Tax=Novosphingobium flavum TaxID=1778672 RepID=A0A7X1FPQ9_9SPHN|nr:outer membrane beta-barrel protein [Novosphingobium flavum]MBC2664613.1 outer membrane beta-barrel protein [Novosphingobium flavum]
MLKYSLLALSLPFAPQFAKAQEAPDFGGIYAGALAGYDHVILSGFGTSVKKDGLVFGAIAGYDALVGSGLVGVEAEVSGSTAKQRENNLVVIGDSGEIKAGRDLYLGVRGGIIMAPSTLVYVKGGYVNGRATVSYTSGGSTSSAGSSVDGWRLGGGVEQAFGVFRARLEYRYSDYRQFQYSGYALGVDAKRHQVVAALVANF